MVYYYLQALTETSRRAREAQRARDGVSRAPEHPLNITPEPTREPPLWCSSGVRVRPPLSRTGG
jgi:hypothetical protein